MGATGGSGGTGATGGGGAGGTTCIPGTTNAKAKPVALYAMVDQSNSMSPIDKTNIVTGFGQYVDSSVSTGVELGLQFFPIQGGSCSSAAYASPLVPIAGLPGNGGAIKNALSNPPAPGNGDPMDAMIQGGTSACKSYANSNPDTQCNLVIVSDYDGGNTCGSSTGALASMLASALNTQPSVMTYVIDTDGTPALTQLASAGGTNAWYASSGSGVRAGLQRAASACRYALPSSGVATWKLSGQLLTAVSGVTACSSQAGPSEYYLTSNAMVLCPRTCSDGEPNKPVTVTVTCS
jgi:hypothetical protein